MAKVKAVELGVFDRLILLNVLPKEGDYTTLRIVRDMQAELSFSEEEHAALAFKQDEGNVQWKHDADTPKSIEFGEKAVDIVCETLKKLDADKKLTAQHMGVYEKFVEVG